MKAWLQFTKERLPLVSYALIVGGFVLSAKALTQSPWSLELLVPFIGLMLFFIELRLMDELKDYAKDVIAHPQRPLPRGLVRVESVKKAVNALLLLMIAFAIGSLAASYVATIFYGAIILYLYLMYKEFFIGEGLAQRPFLYACTHQIVIVLLLAYAAVALLAPAFTWPTTYQIGFLILGCFFTYEVCRKMDPKAHPILKTYLSVYGKKGVSLILIFIQAVSWTAAFMMGEKVILLGLMLGSLLLLLSWLLFWTDESKYKWVEATGTLSLLISLYIVPFGYWLTRG